MSAHGDETMRIGVRMPILDGIAAVKTLRGGFEGVRQPDTPAIAIMARAMRGYKEERLEAEMDDAISTPVQIQALEKLLMKWYPGGEKK